MLIVGASLEHVMWSGCCYWREQPWVDVWHNRASFAFEEGWRFTDWGSICFKSRYRVEMDEKLSGISVPDVGCSCVKWVCSYNLGFRKALVRSWKQRTEVLRRCALLAWYNNMLVYRYRATLWKDGRNSPCFPSSYSYSQIITCFPSSDDSMGSS